MVTFRIKALLLSLLFLTLTLSAQDKNSTLLILPFDSNGIDPVYVETAQSILRVEIGKIGKFDIISENKTLEILNGTDCFSTDCAIEIGKEAGAIKGCRMQAGSVGR